MARPFLADPFLLQKAAKTSFLQIRAASSNVTGIFVYWVSFFEFFNRQY